MHMMLSELSNGISFLEMKPVFLGRCYTALHFKTRNTNLSAVWKSTPRPPSQLKRGPTALKVVAFLSNLILILGFNPESTSYIRTGFRKLQQISRLLLLCMTGTAYSRTASAEREGVIK